MRVALIHNFYQQPGGEDGCYDAEARLLEDAGHEVLRIEERNEAIAGRSLLSVAAGTLWSEASRKRLERLLRAGRIEVAHFHNTFPLLSPAAYYGAKSAGAAVVQTLHNFRLVCPGALLYRGERICEDCLGRAVPWPAVLHRCYRDSRAATASVAAMLTLHAALRTWSRKVDVFVALTAFAKRKMAEGGLPQDRIAVKPNFLHDDLVPGTGSGDYVVFVGRLTEEKGVADLVCLWERTEDLPQLRILGDGPLAAPVAASAQRCPRIRWLGRRSPKEVEAEIGEARLLVFPSRWYEGMPRTLIESLAKGTPVVASRIGGLPEMVQPGVNGELVAPGDMTALAEAVRKLVADEDRLQRLRQGARRTYEEKYSAGRNYQQLMEIYGLALGRDVVTERHALRREACGGG